jgi:hypothetical protein
MTWPDPELMPVNVNQYGPYASQADFEYGAPPPLPSVVQEQFAVIEQPRVEAARAAKAAFKPSPAHNVAEFKPAAPQSGGPATPVRLNTPDKKFEAEHRPQGPDPTRFGVIVGMKGVS